MDQEDTLSMEDSLRYEEPSPCESLSNLDDELSVDNDVFRENA